MQATVTETKKAAVLLNDWELAALERALEEYMSLNYRDLQDRDTPFARSVKALYDKISTTVTA